MEQSDVSRKMLPYVTNKIVAQMTGKMVTNENDEILDSVNIPTGLVDLVVVIALLLFILE